MSNFRSFIGTAPSRDSLERASVSGITLAAAWSFGCWFRPDRFNDYPLLMRVGDVDSNGTNGSIQVVAPTTGNLQVQMCVGGGRQSAVQAVTWSTGTWYRCGGTRGSGAGQANLSAVVNGSGTSEFRDAPAALVSPAFVMGGAGDGDLGAGNNCDHSLAWGFWLQGVELTATQIDNYLNDPESLYNAYGPSGSITANALKLLWPMQAAGSTELDLSSSDNDGTYTGTTRETTSGPTPSNDWDGNPIADEFCYITSALS